LFKKRSCGLVIYELINPDKELDDLTKKLRDGNYQDLHFTGLNDDFLQLLIQL